MALTESGRPVFSPIRSDGALLTNSPILEDGEMAFGLRTDYVLTAAVGTYTYTGQAATLRVARRLIAGVGTYTLTGQDATLTYTPVSVVSTLYPQIHMRCRRQPAHAATAPPQRWIEILS